jgi:hypothetical protein
MVFDSTSYPVKIVGVEVVAVGSSCKPRSRLMYQGNGLSRLIPRIDSDLPIIGGALVLIGLEIVSLIKQLPHGDSS